MYGAGYHHTLSHTLHVLYPVYHQQICGNHRPDQLNINNRREAGNEEMCNLVGKLMKPGLDPSA